MTRHDNNVATRFTIFRKEFVASTQMEAAKILNCSQSKISEIESAKQAIDFEIVSQMIQRFSLNAEWLATGKGELRTTVINAPPKKKRGISGTDNDFNKLLSDLTVLEKTILVMQTNNKHFINVVEKGFKVIGELEQQILSLKQRVDELEHQKVS